MVQNPVPRLFYHRDADSVNKNKVDIFGALCFVFLSGSKKQLYAIWLRNDCKMDDNIIENIMPKPLTYHQNAFGRGGL